MAYHSARRGRRRVQRVSAFEMVCIVLVALAVIGLFVFMFTQAKGNVLVH